MFSQLFRKKQSDLLVPYSHESNIKVVRLVKSVLYAIRSANEHAERYARWDREELLQFYNSARQLLLQLEDVETAVAQKVAYRVY